MTDGPDMDAETYVWIKHYTAVTVGTVIIMVNEATNETSTTTSYLTEYEASGSSNLLQRTDTNDAGTVTIVTTGLHKKEITL